MEQNIYQDTIDGYVQYRAIQRTIFGGSIGVFAVRTRKRLWGGGLKLRSDGPQILNDFRKSQASPRTLLTLR